ncbi:MAG: FkbM family methyltransferase [Xanthobacteraceae bacterium]
MQPAGAGQFGRCRLYRKVMELVSKARGSSATRTPTGVFRRARRTARNYVFDTITKHALFHVLTRHVPPEQRFWQSILELGILNYQSDTISGERNFVEKYLATRPGAVVVDVGANIGNYSCLVLEIAPTATIHAFEPHPKIFQSLIQRNVPNLVPYQMALGAEPGPMTLFDYENADGSEHASVYSEVFSRIYEKEAVSHQVVCETLDRIAEKLDLKVIDLLKIDVEGHELAVLRGAASLIERGCIKAIQFEFNEMNVISRTFMRDYHDILKSYRFFRLLSDGAIDLSNYMALFQEIFAYQNIVCIHQDVDFSFD